MNAAELPNRRVEAWKYSDLRAAVGASLPATKPKSAERDELASLARAEGDIIGLLAAEYGLADKRDIVGINETVVHWTSEAFAPRFDVLNISPGAHLTRVIVQGGEGVNLYSTRVRLGAGATFRQFVLAQGARLARIETHVDVVGEGAEVELNGVYMCDTGRHADLTSIIRHNAQGGITRQLIKGVARKGGRGVFQGKIVVERGAQKTDARQYHHGMLLEDGAEVFAKPELMIHADDVQCAHGNTAGGLDERAVFYMRSRGLREAEARALLIESFLVEAIPAGLPEALNEELVSRIRAWLMGGAT